jgi:hypothetical protein
LKILFSLPRFGALEAGLGLVRALARAGHAVHMTFVDEDSPEKGSLPATLSAEFPHVTYSRALRPESTNRFPWRRKLWSLEEKIGRWAVGWRRIFLAPFLWFLRFAASRGPVGSSSLLYLRARAPQLLVLSLGTGSGRRQQREYARAAGRLGIPAVVVDPSGETPDPDLASMVRRLEDAVPPAVPRAPEGWAVTEDSRAAEMRALVRRLLQSDGPLIAGPWVSEVGYELLGWIPFLNWLSEYAPELAPRLTVMSRGGTASWYGPLGVRYADVFDFMPPEEFRDWNERRAAGQRGKIKQKDASSLDGELLARAGKALGWAPDAEVLHPSVMYRLFAEAWRLSSSAGIVNRWSSHRRFSRPPPVSGAEPPPAGAYAVARFYFSEAFPDTPENRAFAARTVDAISERMDVVLLSSTLRVDDHSDFRGGGGRVRRVDPMKDPRSNLAVQSHLIAGAKLFVGTYGGFSYLAPHYGVDSLSFHDRAGRFLRHPLEMAGRIFSAPGWGRFLAVGRGDVDLLSTLGGGRPLTAKEGGS